MSTTRRTFLQGSALGAAGLLLPSCQSTRSRRAIDSTDAVRVGVIGVGNQGHWNLGELAAAGAEIRALCDVDDAFLGKAASGFPRARTFTDYRELLLLDDLDAVLIATPDHHHAPATVRALARGLDVYCEKPLTHSVHEARAVAELARRQQAVTQMGTQIHATPNYRRVVELVQAGAIGPVHAVHAFCNGKSWSGGEAPTDATPVPATLHWDLWLGPARSRPYSPLYLPESWRRWWDFGGGTLADMACHLLDLAWWALDLTHPLSIEAHGPVVHPDTAPEWLIVHWQHPARGQRPAVEVRWYDGSRRPEVLAELGLADWQMGVLFLGARGWLVTDYAHHALGPKESFAGFVPPAPTIPDSVGHHREWLDACRTRGRTSCNFAYAGALSEAVLLGNVAYRLGRRLEWDAARLEATNAPEAASLIHLPHRQGWEV